MEKTRQQLLPMKPKQISVLKDKTNESKPALTTGQARQIINTSIKQWV
jgi:hypothetical protein